MASAYNEHYSLVRTSVVNVLDGRGWKHIKWSATYGDGMWGIVLHDEVLSGCKQLTADLKAAKPMTAACKDALTTTCIRDTALRIEAVLTS